MTTTNAEHQAPPSRWPGTRGRGRLLASQVPLGRRGFRGAGAFSTLPNAIRKLNPFLLLDDHSAHNSSPTPHRRGVGAHPHREYGKEGER